MKAFADNLSALPPMPEIPGLRLTGPEGEDVLVPNQPGSQGSLRLYAYLLDRYGEIGVEAAEEGLRLYAEHTEDARVNPGKHPNIDRLLSIVADRRAWQGAQLPA